MSNAPDLTPSSMEGLSPIGKPRAKFAPVSRDLEPVPRPDGASSALYAVINAMVAGGANLPEPHMLEHVADARSVSGVLRSLEQHGYLKVEPVNVADIVAHVSARGPVVYAQGHDVYTVTSVDEEGALSGVDPLGRATAVHPDGDDGVAFLVR